MRAFYDLRGRELTPGRCIGRGGEGAVYALGERPGRVAKIYARRPDDSLAQKVAAMIALRSPELTGVSAWPEGLLLESRGGPVAGFLMPRVQGHREIHSLYGPTSRKAHFPRATWAFLVRAARNLAAAFETVHRHGLVVGDVNPGNAVVSPQALVRLIDCDSFQVTRERTWPCRVGVPQFTPPELQGQRFDAVVRTAEHDAFGLAVLIFHLLFMGRHPFAGLHPGTREVPIEQAIREELFAFGWEGAAQGCAPPPHALRLTDVPPAIRGLFEEALGRGRWRGTTRPTPRQWVRALDALERSLVRCEDVPTHVHAGTNGGCPWCRIESDGGPFFFGQTPRPRPGAGFDLDTAWQAIEAVERPERAPLPVLPPEELDPPGRGLPLRMLSRRTRRVLAVLVACAVVLVVLASGGAASGLVILAVWLLPEIVGRSEEERTEQELRELIRVEREQKLRAAEGVWERDCGEAGFQETKAALRRLRAEHEGLAGARDHELARLQAQAAERALRRHLAGYLVESCLCRAADEGARLALSQAGISTAADVTPESLEGLEGLDPQTRRHLLAWRQTFQSAFVPGSAARVSPARVRAVHEKYSQRQKAIEARLVCGPAELRSCRVAAREAREKLRPMVIGARRLLAQAEADLKRV